MSVPAIPRNGTRQALQWAVSVLLSVALIGAGFFIKHILDSVVGLQVLMSDMSNRMATIEARVNQIDPRLVNIELKIDRLADRKGGEP